MEEICISLGTMVGALVTLILSLIRLPFSFFKTPRKNPTSILITGASSGIGETLAIKYSAPNVFLALTGRNKDRLNEVAEACRALGASVEIVLIDVTDASSLASFIHKVDDEHPLDLVIANAGVSGGIIGDKPHEEKIKIMFDINVTGVFNTINPILARFRDRKAGQIAVVASLSGIFDYPRSAAYSASKVALITYCRSLRGLMKPYNVAVNAICPGYVQTKFTQYSHAQGRSTPFLMSPERASSIIASGLAYNKPVIAFPLQMYMLVSMMSVLPAFAIDIVLDFLPIKKVIPWNQIG